MESILTNLERVKADVQAWDTTIRRVMRERDELESTLARVQAERDAYKTNADENARLAEAAEKELAAFKARVQEFIQ